FFFSSRRRHTRVSRDWSSDVCSSDLEGAAMEKERAKALDSALSQIERQFGRGAVMRLGAEPVGVLSAGVISTGSLSVDVALGVEIGRASCRGSGQSGWGQSGQ